jgi:biotin carboxyl carrier protein
MEMKLVLELDGKSYPVTVSADETTYTVDLDGERVVLDARTAKGSGALSLLVEGRDSVEAWAVPNGLGYEVSVLGGQFHVEVEDALRHGLRRLEASAPHAVEEIIRAPMPGVVVEVKAEEGHDVEAGQSIIIVEAMKMRNEFGPKAAGRVDKILVRPGQTVERNQDLARVVRGAATSK